MSDIDRSGDVVDVDTKISEVHHQSQQHNVESKLPSTSNPTQKSSSDSTTNQGNPNLPETRTTSEVGFVVNVATEKYNPDPLREMLTLLRQNPDKIRPDATKYAHLTMLDFAGQYAFYTTHQMFLTRRAIYLLVSDTSKMISELVTDECYFDTQGILDCKVHDLVEVWMNSIHSCASPGKEVEISTKLSYKVISPPVILVGTHIDQIPQNRHGIIGNVMHQFHQLVSPEHAKRAHCRKQGLRKLEEIRSYLREKPAIVHLVEDAFAIDNTVVDSQLEELKKKIVDVASHQSYWGEEIPTRWFLVEQQLMRLKDAGVKVIHRKTVEELNNNGTVKITEPEELDLFLKYLNEIGTIIYFSIEVMRDHIVLDSKWLIDALKSLINAQPNPPNTPANNDKEANSLSTSGALDDIIQKWSDFKHKGILTLELIDAIWTKEIHPELHAHKTHILMIMEQFNILAKPRSFNEMGEKVEDYFLAPCMLRQGSPEEVISPEQDPSRVTTPEMCCIFIGKYLPSPIFHRLLAACVARWPVARNETENLIFCGCCVFDLDLFHRLTVYMNNHVVSAKITRLVIDEVKTPDVRLCSRVRRFITMNLSKITSYLGQNLQYELKASFQTWHADEGHDSEAPITREHMNHSRLCVALVTICGSVMREVLHTHVPSPHSDIYQAILANKGKLTCRRGKPLLNSSQIQLVFPDPQGKTTGNMDQFDLSLLYTLIRNVSTVAIPVTKWGYYPNDNPRDISLGASVERIRCYRNRIIGHSMDGKTNQQDFENFWNDIDAVIYDIENALGKRVYREQLARQKKQVISVHERC